QRADGGAQGLRVPTEAYLPTQDLRRYFGNNSITWFVDETIAPMPDAAAQQLLAACGVRRFPRVLSSAPALSPEEKAALRRGHSDGSCTYELSENDKILDGLDENLKRL